MSTSEFKHLTRKQLIYMIIELRTENERLKNELMNEDDDDEIEIEPIKQCQFLQTQLDSIKQELQRYKNKFDCKTLEQFMKLYGWADRIDLKDIQKHLLAETGLKYSIAKLSRELPDFEYNITICGNHCTSYANRKPEGYIYLVQLNKHKDTTIYKAGKTFKMTSRLATYKKQDGGATQLRCEFINNSLKAEKFLLAELNKLVVEN
ncbi:hypothetical protein M9Y10_033338 [Tritrichomonas musculus]|uniref:Uncharacterized protein n=1 Tax=Tritrichomonas musculus TaxID=1915356 RepID=A0ABR2KBV4_9EUKA